MIHLLLLVFIHIQFCAKFDVKRRYLKKITIDNQQVTDGGRVLLNPASATNNDITSYKTTGYVVFFCFRVRQICDKDFHYKNGVVPTVGIAPFYFCTVFMIIKI